MADESKFEQAKGNVKETVGNVTDNKNLENEGKEDKASGKAKEFVNVRKKLNKNSLMISNNMYTKRDIYCI